MVEAAFSVLCRALGQLVVAGVHTNGFSLKALSSLPCEMLILSINKERKSQGRQLRVPVRRPAFFDYGAFDFVSPLCLLPSFSSSIEMSSFFTNLMMGANSNVRELFYKNDRLLWTFAAEVLTTSPPQARLKAVKCSGSRVKCLSYVTPSSFNVQLCQNSL